jgi:hypothetical protein
MDRRITRFLADVMLVALAGCLLYGCGVWLFGFPLPG